MKVLELTNLVYKLPNEMPFWKRVIWLVFGKRLEGDSDGWKVVGYKFRGITLIVECEEK